MSEEWGGAGPNLSVSPGLREPSQLRNLLHSHGHSSQWSKLLQAGKLAPRAYRNV